MTVKQISVFLENQPGKLAEVAAVLSAQKINLRAISVAEASDFGIARIIVDDVFNAVTVLKSENYICSITDVLAVEIFVYRLKLRSLNSDGSKGLLHLLSANGIPLFSGQPPDILQGFGKLHFLIHLFLPFLI